jgi:cell division protein FtsI (penicillin-binding protein 3)
MPQTIAFHPQNERRVLSPFVAAQMKQMMQRVVLPGGTGTKAILEGYSSAGKTGTAQKVDPGTHAYSRTNYVASFAGFAPVNNPAIAVAVILDSAVGLHQGGQIAAPVFQRVAQQVLAYLNVPHDVDLPASRQLMLASKKAKDTDLDEASPDHLGSPIDVAENNQSEPASVAASIKPSAAIPDRRVQQAALRQMEPSSSAIPNSTSGAVPASTSPEVPKNGTVVLDVEQGGIVVPAFTGKSVRSAIEAAEESGLELDAVGSGIAVDQSPIAGSHVPAGSHITVRFGR